MKRAVSLKLKFLVLLISLFSLSSLTTANAATFALSTGSGAEVFSNTYWGQTFTIPAGKSGTISSISNIGLNTYGNTTANIGRVSIYTSPTKSTLLATATSDFTMPVAAAWGTRTYFTANFSPFSVIENTQYYFELALISSSATKGNYYFLESSSSGYAGGMAYHDGIAQASYDLGMTINIDYSSGPVAISLGLTSGGTQAVFRTVSQLKASTNTAGTVSFYANKKIIPGCRKVATSANIAYCNWKPSVHGAISLSAVVTPTDTANYSTNTVTTQLIGVNKRSNTR